MASPTPRTSICSPAFAEDADSAMTSVSSVTKTGRGQKLICKVGMTPLRAGRPKILMRVPPARAGSARSQTPSTFVGVVQHVFRLSRRRTVDVEAAFSDAQCAFVRDCENSRAACAKPRIQHEWRRKLARPFGGQISGRQSVGWRGFAIGQHCEKLGVEGVEVRRL